MSKSKIQVTINEHLPAVKLKRGNLEITLNQKDSDVFLGYVEEWITAFGTSKETAIQGIAITYEQNGIFD